MQTDGDSAVGRHELRFQIVALCDTVLHSVVT